MLHKYKNRLYFFLYFFFFVHINSFSQIQKDSTTYYENKLLSVDDTSIETKLYYYNKLCENISGKKKVEVLRKKASFLSKYGGKKATISTYQKALKLSKKNNYKLLEGVLYHDLGFYYYNFLNENSSAYKNFLLAHDIYLEINNQEQLNIIKTNIGAFLADDGQYKEASKIFSETLSYYEEKKDTVNIFFVKINVGGLQREMEEYMKSEKTFKDLLNTKNINQSDRSLAYYNLAINSIKQKKHKEANTYINQAISISQTLGETIQLIDLYYLKADIAKEVKKYKKANKYYTKSLVLSKEIEDYPFQKELLKSIISASIKDRNFIVIDSLYNEITIVNDSIINKRKSKTLNEIYLENALNKKEKEILIHHSNLKKEKELTNLYITIIILSLLFILALGAYIISYRKNNYKQLQLAKNKTKIKEIENKTKRKIEKLEITRIQNDLKIKKRELLIDISFRDKRMKNTEKVLKKMEDLSNKSIITKNDILKLIDYTVSKYKNLLKDVKTKSDTALINKEFYENLLKDYPNLSKTELKILSYMGIGFDTKEIANIQNVSIDAIRKTRYRIRKKIGLKPEKSLEKFIIKYQ